MKERGGYETWQGARPGLPANAKLSEHQRLYLLGLVLSVDDDTLLEEIGCKMGSILRGVDRGMGTSARRRSRGCGGGSSAPEAAPGGPGGRKRSAGPSEVDSAPADARAGIQEPAGRAGRWRWRSSSGKEAAECGAHAYGGLEAAGEPEEVAASTSSAGAGASTASAALVQPTAKRAGKATAAEAAATEKVAGEGREEDGEGGRGGEEEGGGGRRQAAEGGAEGGGEGGGEGAL